MPTIPFIPSNPTFILSSAEDYAHEALRELGRFDACLAAIPEVENGPLANVANLIRGLAEKQDPLVAEILGEDW